MRQAGGEGELLQASVADSDTAKMIRHITLKTAFPAVAFCFGLILSHFDLALARRAYLLIFLGPLIMGRFAPELADK